MLLGAKLTDDDDNDNDTMALEDDALDETSPGLEDIDDEISDDVSAIESAALLLEKLGPQIIAAARQSAIALPRVDSLMAMLSKHASAFARVKQSRSVAARAGRQRLTAELSLNPLTLTNRQLSGRLFTHFLVRGAQPPSTDELLGETLTDVDDTTTVIKLEGGMIDDDSALGMILELLGTTSDVDVGPIITAEEREDALLELTECGIDDEIPASGAMEAAIDPLVELLCTLTDGEEDLAVVETIDELLLTIADVVKELDTLSAEVDTELEADVLRRPPNGSAAFVSKVVELTNELEDDLLRLPPNGSAAFVSKVVELDDGVAEDTSDVTIEVV